MFKMPLFVNLNSQFRSFIKTQSIKLDNVAQNSENLTVVFHICSMANTCNLQHSNEKQKQKRL